MFLLLKWYYSILDKFDFLILVQSPVGLLITIGGHCNESFQTAEGFVIALEKDKYPSWNHIDHIDS